MARTKQVREALEVLESVHFLGDTLTPEARRYRLAKAISALHESLGTSVTLHGDGSYVVHTTPIIDKLERKLESGHA
jgi:hypothetical protein